MRLDQWVDARAWQVRLDEYDGYVKIFVKDIGKWCERGFGNLNFYVTQAVCGHGSFGTYPKRIGKANSDIWWYCDARDIPEHTVFECTEFAEHRRRAEAACGVGITKEKVAMLLMRNSDTWNAVTCMLESILREKCLYRRNLRDRADEAI
ncbi:uncharacterized protein [Euwallacea fornicatus]|uniref:uncharacterized protein n=1 Tax=Euwallacea fornicatus TaxID=995702 RepID=UPI00338D86FD